MRQLPTAEQAFAHIRQVAIEHASSQDAGTCRCKHIQVIHDQRWGRCLGKHGSRFCDCSRYQGLHVSRQRMLERYGVALLARLNDFAGFHGVPTVHVAFTDDMETFRFPPKLAVTGKRRQRKQKA